MDKEKLRGIRDTLLAMDTQKIILSAFHAKDHLGNDLVSKDFSFFELTAKLLEGDKQVG